MSLVVSMSAAATEHLLQANGHHGEPKPQREASEEYFVSPLPFGAETGVVPPSLISDKEMYSWLGL